jgi:hypothetical protein
MPSADAKVMLRLGTHAEKDYLTKTIQFFDGLLFGSNLVEATPGATASLMFRFCGKRMQRPYYIDPMTYAFGAYVDDSGKTRTDLDWIKSEQKDPSAKRGDKHAKTVRRFKKSYVGLANAMGTPFKDALKRKSAVNWEDFEAKNSAEACCKAIGEYQFDRLATEFAEDEELSQHKEHIPRPAAILAPYFYIEPSQSKKWAELVMRLAKVTCAVETRLPVHAVICVDATFLEKESFVSYLEKELPKTGVAGVWLWFSALSEDKASKAQLLALRSLVENLGASMQVFNMHGGFYSLALSKFGLSGVSHGVGYGEQKDVLPVIGQSTPMVRYYLPDVHKRFGVPQIQRCFEELKIRKPADFYEQVCDCVICKGVVSDSIIQFKEFGDMHYSHPNAQRQAQTPAAAKRCRFHFLLSRIRERDAMRGATLANIRAGLRESHAKWSGQASFQNELEYLSTWRDALKIE